LSRGSLHQEGVALLSLLSRHAETILDTYLKGSISESDLEPRKLDALMRGGRVLYRPEPGADLRLNPDVERLLKMALQDERNRSIDADTANLVAGIKTLAGHHKEALTYGRMEDADHALLEIESSVYEFKYRLQKGIKGLWSRINSEFGYVTSLSGKIRENEWAQSQVALLIERLGMVKFAELWELAGEQRDLRRILVNTLQRAVSECSEELLSVQNRIAELLGRFRTRQRHNLTLKGWIIHSQRNPDYSATVSDLPWGKELPALLNVAAPILRPANIDVDAAYRQDLLDLATTLKGVVAPKIRKAPAANQPVDMVPAESVDAVADPIQASVESFLIAALDAGGAPVSAAEYLRDEVWEKDCWVCLLLIELDRRRQESESATFVETILSEPRIDAPGISVVQDVIVCVPA